MSELLYNKLLYNLSESFYITNLSWTKAKIKRSELFFCMTKKVSIAMTFQPDADLFTNGQITRQRRKERVVKRGRVGSVDDCTRYRLIPVKYRRIPFDRTGLVCRLSVADQLCIMFTFHRIVKHSVVLKENSI